LGISVIQVAITGAESGLGRAIASRIHSAPDMQVCGVLTHIDRRASDTGRLETLLDGANVLIDLTCPGQMMSNVLACLTMGCAFVSGGSDLDPNHRAELEEYSARIPIFHAPNFCIETAAVLSLLPTLQQTLPYLDTEITGTDCYRRRRRANSSGNALVDPIVVLTGAGQEIMLSQKVYGHDAPARGALHAVRFLLRHEHGFFTMEDLLCSGMHQPDCESGLADMPRVR
jgi:dihydrodipicolinate reductase